MRVRQAPIATLLAPTVLALPLLVGACGDDDPTGLSMDEVAGTYGTTTFTLTEGGTTTDVLAEGGSLEITLSPDGTTDGTLVIPASLSESGQEEQLSMAGTWRVLNNVVEFTQVVLET